MSGGGKKQTTGYRYYMGLHMGLCAGPVDALLTIKIGDRQAWAGNVTASGAITIDAPNLFGGEDKEGGVAGTLDVMMGEAAQTENAYLTAKQVGVQPAYRGLLGVVFRQGLVSMNNPYVKPWAFKVRRILKGWQSDSVWYSAKAVIVLPGGVGQAMNPAHIVYECMTNAEWGMGYGSSLIEDANFRAAADVFHAEGLGLCMLWAQQSTIEAFIQTVLDHAGANLAQDPRTGLFTMTPLRGGYDVNTLPEFDESNVLALESFERAASPEAVNELSVKFRDLATGTDSSVTVHNLANITAQGGVVSQSKNYPGLPTADLAIRVALRDLRVMSTPLAKVRMRVTRDGYALLPGGLIRLNWPKLGVSGLVLRVLRVGYGSPTDARIEIEAAEDVFALGATGYAQQQPIGWADPNNDPAPTANRVVTEAPLYELNRALSAAEIGALSGDEGFLFVAAGKPTSDAQGFEIRTRPGLSGTFEQAATGDFAPSGTLTAAIGPGDTAATLTNLIDSDLIVAGRYALIGAEVVRVDTFNASTGSITFGRGVLDTVASSHGLGAAMLFADPYDATDGIERVDGDVLQVKLLPRTGRGQLAEASAPTDTVTFDQRPLRPYPPGRLRINGQLYPVSLVEVQPTFTWAHRDRTQQNLEGDESTNIGPEPGTTYSIELRNAGTDTVVASATGMSGTSYTPIPPPAGAFNMRVRLWAVRGGLESRQRHDYVFAYAYGTAATAPGATISLPSAHVSPPTSIGTAAALVQTPAPVSAGSAYVAIFTITGADPVPGGSIVSVVLAESLDQVAVPTIATYTYTTSGATSKSAVADALAAQMQASSAITSRSISVTRNDTLGSPGIQITGPIGLPFHSAIGADTPGVRRLKFVMLERLSVFEYGLGSEYVPTDRPKVISVQLSGTPARGDLVQVTVAGSVFSYRARNDDTLAMISGGLAVLIDADPTYSTYTDGAKLFVVGDTSSNNFTYSATVRGPAAYGNDSGSVAIAGRILSAEVARIDP